MALYVLAVRAVLIMISAMNPSSTMGTVISTHHLKRIDAMVKARSSGALHAGGEPMTGESALDGFRFSSGSFYPPTVIADVSTSDEIWTEEIFGPVVVVKRFQVSTDGPLESIPVSRAYARICVRVCVCVLFPWGWGAG